MKQKELGLAKAFMMISSWTKPFGLHDLYKYISVLQGLTLVLLGPYIYIYVFKLVLTV